jgi:hypothetical protein
MKNLVITLELIPPFPYFIEKDDLKIAGPFATVEEARATLASLKGYE